MKKRLLNHTVTAAAAAAAADPDSDIEIIESNITVIDLDETSMDNTTIIVADTAAAAQSAAIMSPPTYSQVLRTPTRAAAKSFTETLAAVADKSIVVGDSPGDVVNERLYFNDTLGTHTAAGALQNPNERVFFNDTLGTHTACALQIPLYDPISDDSLCSEVALTPRKTKPTIPYIDLDDVSFSELNQAMVIDSTTTSTTTTATTPTTITTTPDCTIVSATKRNKRKSNFDNSVIFVSETLLSPSIQSTAESFIPLPILVSLILGLEFDFFN